MPGFDDLLRGRVLDERYRLDQLIGRGAMGTVYRAMDTRLERSVAIKVIAIACDDEDQQRQHRKRFTREARSAARLRHPNIVVVHDYGTDPDTDLDYLVMELLSGQDLAARLRQSGRIPVAEAVAILQQAADGLAAGHRQGIIHRDVKPGNLFVEAPEEGSPATVKLLDFGIALPPAPEGTLTHLTVFGHSPATPSYASPEQLRGDPSLTPASDVFSLGVVAYEMLAGVRPHEPPAIERLRYGEWISAAPLHTVVADVPPELGDLVQRAIAPSARDRPADAGQFAARLRGLRGHRKAAGAGEDRTVVVDSATPVRGLGALAQIAERTVAFTGNATRTVHDPSGQTQSGELTSAPDAMVSSHGQNVPVIQATALVEGSNSARTPDAADHDPHLAGEGAREVSELVASGSAGILAETRPVDESGDASAATSPGGAQAREPNIPTMGRGFAIAAGSTGSAANQASAAEQSRGRAGNEASTGRHLAGQVSQSRQSNGQESGDPTFAIRSASDISPRRRNAQTRVPAKASRRGSGFLLLLLLFVGAMGLSSGSVGDAVERYGQDFREFLAPRGDWLVILGSFRHGDLEEAEEHVERLQRQGVRDLQIVNTDDLENLRDGYWSVALGPFDRQQAFEAADRLGDDGVIDAYARSADGSGSEASDIDGAFDGVIGESSRVRMFLRTDGNRVTGHYYYQRYRLRASLEGTLGSRREIRLRGSYDGEVIDHFTGTIDEDGTIRGRWTNPDDTRTLAFVLRPSL